MRAAGSGGRRGGSEVAHAALARTSHDMAILIARSAARALARNPASAHFADWRSGPHFPSAVSPSASSLLSLGIPRPEGNQQTSPAVPRGWRNSTSFRPGSPAWHAGPMLAAAPVQRIVSTSAEAPAPTQAPAPFYCAPHASALPRERRLELGEASANPDDWLAAGLNRAAPVGKVASAALPP